MRAAAAAALAVSPALAGGVARAADGDQFVGTWLGRYSNTKGDKVDKSTITIRPSAGGGLTGDWDGYDIASAVVSGNTLTGLASSKPRTLVPMKLTATT